MAVDNVNTTVACSDCEFAIIGTDALGLSGHRKIINTI